MMTQLPSNTHILQLNTFTEALSASRTAISFRFLGWLSENMNVFASYKEGLGYI